MLRNSFPKVALVCLALFVLGCAALPVNDRLFPITASRDRIARFDADGDGKYDLIERDIDGDGTFDFYQFSVSPDTRGARKGKLVITHKQLAREDVRRLIVFTDGIPAGLLEEMWDEGYFREFYRPSRLVSPFPSMTFPSFTDMFKSKPMPGYEESYYDWKLGRLAGGVKMRLQPWPEDTLYSYFDYKEPGIFGGIIYICPWQITSEDFEGGKECFFKNMDRQQVVVYYACSDGIAHKLGKEGAKKYFIALDKILREMFIRSKHPLKMVVASDHGDNFIKSKRITITNHLKRHGFRRVKAIKRRGDVVIPSYGLVGFFVAYTFQGEERKLSEAVKDMKGVDFSLFREGDAAVVLGKRGEARIYHDPKWNAYKYETVKGDPLELSKIAAQLRSEGKLNGDGFAADADWFRATLNHKYPDALHRLYRAAMNHVQNKPNVIVSLEDGYFYGKKVFSKICPLMGTHGSLIDSSTFGYIMTNYKPLPRYVRSEDVFKALQ